MLKYYKLTVDHFLSSCNMCHSNKLESVFECEVSRLLYDEGGSWVLDVWTSRLNGGVCDQSCHRLYNARWPIMFSSFFRNFILTSGINPRQEIIIGLRENLQSACFVSKSSTSCLGSFYITKLILLSKMGRKFYCLWSTQFHVSFVSTLIFRKTILISTRC